MLKREPEYTHGGMGGAGSLVTRVSASDEPTADASGEAVAAKAEEVPRVAVVAKLKRATNNAVSAAALRLMLFTFASM